MAGYQLADYLAYFGIAEMLQFASHWS